jgi:hypothetical protein
MSKITPLLGEGQQSKLADLEVEVTFADFTSQATANTALAITVGPIAAKTSYNLVSAELVTPFEDTADAAFNSNTVNVGDTGSAVRHLSALQINKNGTPVFLNHGTGTRQLYTTADSIIVTLNSMAGKSLSTLKKGILRLYFKAYDAGQQTP